MTADESNGGETQMHRKHALLALMVGLLVVGTVEADVNVEADPNFDLGAYSSYAWRDGTPAKRDAAEQRIRDSVDREMVAAGLQRTDEAADLWVVTHVLVDRHSIIDLRDQGYWQFYAGIRSVDAYDLAAGTLVVDLVDAKLEQIVWRGVVSKKIDKRMKANSNKIDKWIHSVFERLPR
jgi:hypothetical protein